MKLKSILQTKTKIAYNFNMKKHVLFIQGGGNEGYEADAKLADSLKNSLGEKYDVQYPRMHVDESKPDFGWCQQIENEIETVNGSIILVAHSLGASMLLKYLSESEIKKQIHGIFLLSTPFWSGNEDWVKGLKLQKEFAHKLPKDISLFFYHCKDDEEVSFDHFLLYKQKLPWATFYEIPKGGHQLNNDLTIVANDIKTL
jgi:uncharacterized protein